MGSTNTKEEILVAQSNVNSEMGNTSAGSAAVKDTLLAATLVIVFLGLLYALYRAVRMWVSRVVRLEMAARTV